MRDDTARRTWNASPCGKGDCSEPARGARACRLQCTAWSDVRHILSHTSSQDDPYGNAREEMSAQWWMWMWSWSSMSTLWAHPNACSSCGQSNASESDDGIWHFRIQAEQHDGSWSCSNVRACMLACRICGIQPRAPQLRKLKMTTCGNRVHTGAHRNSSPYSQRRNVCGT